MSPLKIKRNQMKKIKKTKTILPSTLVSASLPEELPNALPNELIPNKLPNDLLLTSLPNDLILSCFARVSRLYYPNLSLVCKRFWSLLASPHVYKFRSLLGRTQSCLYICLRSAPDNMPRWFTLCLRPNPNPITINTIKKNKMSTWYDVAKLPIPYSPPVHSSSLVAVGSNIYNIGGSSEEAPSSSVSILDCHSNTWHEAPSMKMERFHHAANVYDGKIYVTGGCEEGSILNWMEVFDIKTQSWEVVLSPLADRSESKIFKSAVMDGEIYTSWLKGVVYIPKEYKWKEITAMTKLFQNWNSDSYCVVDNILFSHHEDFGIIWYNSKLEDWYGLEGLDRPPFKLSDDYVKLVDYGGKLVVLLDKYLSRDKTKKKIWCAVIALEKGNLWENELWGKVEWLDVVLKVPESYEFVSALSVTI